MLVAAYYKKGTEDQTATETEQALLQALIQGLLQVLSQGLLQSKVVNYRGV